MVTHLSTSDVPPTEEIVNLQSVLYALLHAISAVENLEKELSL